MSRIFSIAAAAAVIGYAGLALAQQPAYQQNFQSRFAREPAIGSTTAPIDRNSAMPWQRQSTVSREAPGNAGANSGGQFASEAEAKARCGSDTVVWVNTKSRVYHFPGSRDFGKTKHGAFMCQIDADRAGRFRAAKNEMSMRGESDRMTPPRTRSNLSQRF